MAAKNHRVLPLPERPRSDEEWRKINDQLSGIKAGRAHSRPTMSWCRGCHKNLEDNPTEEVLCECGHQGKPLRFKAAPWKVPAKWSPLNVD